MYHSGVKNRSSKCFTYLAWLSSCTQNILRNTHWSNTQYTVAAHPWWRMACPPKNGDIWSSGSSHHASDGPYKTDPEDKRIQVRTYWTCIVSHALNLGLRVTWPQCYFSAFEQLIRESGRVKCSSMSASQQVTRQWEPQVLVSATNRSGICHSE